MNYLAHLQLSDVTSTSAIGNLLGDFVKGPVAELPYDYAIKVGVQLHRKVDVFTDKHAYVASLKKELGPWRRYAGIILDVLFDHQLALNFERIHSISLANFSKQTYLRLELDQQYPERFHRVVNGMKAGDWLTGYQSKENIHRALQGIGQRLRKPVDLQQSLLWCDEQKIDLESGFLSFYQDLTRYAVEQANLLKVHPYD